MGITIVGDIAVDHLCRVDSFPKVNSNSLVKDFSVSFGGSAANTAVACAQLGAETNLLACVGYDFPKDYYSKLERLWLVKYLQKSEKRTTAVFDFNKGDDQMTFFYAGASRDLDKIEPPSGIEEAKIIHFCRDFAGMFKKILRKKKNLVSFNPGFGLDEIKKGTLKSMLKKTDVLFLNRHEHAYLQKLFRKDPRRLGVKIVVKTLGSRGCQILSGRTISVKAIPTKVVDPTGAGDAFAAGFLVGLNENKSLEECARLGCATASKTIASPIAQPEFSRVEIEKLVKKYY